MREALDDLHNEVTERLDDAEPGAAERLTACLCELETLLDAADREEGFEPQLDLQSLAAFITDYAAELKAEDAE